MDNTHLLWKNLDPAEGYMVKLDVIMDKELISTKYRHCGACSNSINLSSNGFCNR